MSPGGALIFLEALRSEDLSEALHELGDFGRAPDAELPVDGDAEPADGLGRDAEPHGDEGKEAQQGPAAAPEGPRASVRVHARDPARLGSP